MKLNYVWRKTSFTPKILLSLPPYLDIVVGIQTQDACCVSLGFLFIYLFSSMIIERTSDPWIGF